MKRTLKEITGLLISTLIVFLVILTVEIAELKEKNLLLLEEDNKKEEIILKAYQDIDSLGKDIIVLETDKKQLENVLDEYNKSIKILESLKDEKNNLELANKELKENNKALNMYIVY